MAYLTRPPTFDSACFTSSLSFPSPALSFIYPYLHSSENSLTVEPFRVVRPGHADREPRMQMTREQHVPSQYLCSCAAHSRDGSLEMVKASSDVLQLVRRQELKAVRAATRISTAPLPTRQAGMAVRNGPQQHTLAKTTNVSVYKCAWLRTLEKLDLNICPSQRQ